MRGNHGQRPRWRDENPDVYAELKRSYGVLGHCGVLMVLSLSLIGTALTVGFLQWPDWLERTVRLVASLGAVCCSVFALGRLVRAVWRTLRALLRSRRPRADERGEGGANPQGAAEVDTASASSARS